MATTYLALQTVLLGNTPPAQPGEEIPATYIDSNGDVQPVDFDRLLELGAAEPAASAKRKSGS